MISKDKIANMSKMAIFENSKTGRMAIRSTKFFKTDFVRFELLKTIISVSLAYLIIWGIYIIYNIEYIVKNATKINYKEIGIKALGIYIIFLVIYLVVSLLISSYRYKQGKKAFSKYNRFLKNLERAEED